MIDKYYILERIRIGDIGCDIPSDCLLGCREDRILEFHLKKGSWYFTVADILRTDHKELMKYSGFGKKCLKNFLNLRNYLTERFKDKIIQNPKDILIEELNEVSKQLLNYGYTIELKVHKLQECNSNED